MKNFKKGLRYSIYLLLPTVLCVGCNDYNKYSDNELMQMQKGDTMYVKDFGTIMMTTIIHNDTIKEILQVNIGNKMKGNELDLWMKECWSYKDVKSGRGSNGW